LKGEVKMKNFLLLLALLGQVATLAAGVYQALTENYNAATASFLLVLIIQSLRIELEEED